MVSAYKISISPLCGDELINYFDAIATAMRLYDRAKVFFDLRDGPLRFIPMNTAYSIILDDNSGDITTDYYGVAMTLTRFLDIKQIERIFVDKNGKKAAENLHNSGIFFEFLESVLLDKQFSVDNLSLYDFDFISKIISSERNALPIKIPNLHVHTIELKNNDEIYIDGQLTTLQNIPEKVRWIEKQALQNEEYNDLQSLNELTEFFGASITDDCYCYFNVDAKFQDYSHYKIRLVEWFMQLDYSELSNYSGNNHVVEKLLSCINSDAVILPKDYFANRPFHIGT